MRNQQAARYARWAAAAACAITLIVVSFYAERAVRGYLLRRHGPPPVPVTVQQQSADFSYSDVEAGRTIFTVRASHAVQFKDEDRALLQDVWVTLYGRQGDRNDNIHTRECSYQPKAGTVQCAGDVDIDIQAAAPAAGGQKSTGPGATLAQSLHVKTSNLSFNRETGEASTPAPVDLTFSGGQGHGEGLHYDAHDSVVRVERGVELQMAASDRTGDLPVSAAAANLEFHRDERMLALGGPVAIRQGDRELSAEHVAIGLDQNYHAQTISAEGHPAIRARENGAEFAVTADRFQGALNSAGALQNVTAAGNVDGTRKTPAGDDHFSAGHIEFAMLPEGNQLKEMTASGGVTADSRAGANARTLKTSALRVSFAPATKGTGAKGTGAAAIGKQKVESAETLGPATIHSKDADSALDLQAAKFVAEFSADGKLSRLLGHSSGNEGAQESVQIVRTPSTGAAQTSTASELAATFGPGGDWASLDETGNVRLTEADRTATAAHARVVQATDQITLDGSPVITDATSQTSAGSVVINQKTGEIRAAGRVVATEFGAASGPSRAPSPGAISLGEGAAHISADALTASTASGRVAFQGHARLWQGQAVLQADRIDLSKQEGTLRASGDVIGVFPQLAGQGPQLPSAPAKKTTQSPPGVTLWQVHAPLLTYFNDQAKAHLEGGVTASSDQGALQSKTLDVFLAPSPALPQAAGPAKPTGSRSLDRILALGGVTIVQGVQGGAGEPSGQGQLQARAEQAQYSASDGKFVLSGGEPTITDGSGNTTSGRSLTFYGASDTISVDSEEGSRTLTKHRVEK